MIKIIVYDVKFASTYTRLLYHQISDGSDRLKKLQKVLISIRVSPGGKKKQENLV